VGSLFYDTGYYNYANPYCEPAAVVQYPAIDYSQPIVTTAALPDADSATATASVSDSEQARNAFYRGDYAQALTSIDAALSKTPGDIVLHEFRALIQFAMKKYKEAAGTLYAVLSVGPGWDWTTLVGLYPNVEVYTQQLRALEQYVRENSDSPDARFVLAYQYMSEGEQKAAAHQFEDVLRLVPNDQVSRQMLALIAPAKENSPGTAPATPAETPSAQAESKPISPGEAVGNWRAATPNGGNVELALGSDSRFTWKYSQANKTQSFDGKYELAGTTLVLDYSNGGTMVGKVRADGENRFSFKMVGGPPNDPGLTFSK
jgi:tetratricopeptide (TPR) repeat protein